MKLIKITGGHKDFIGKTGALVSNYQNKSIIVKIGDKNVVVQKGDYEELREKMKYYFCGADYRKNGKEEFGAVRPTHGLPYVRFTEKEGRDLFSLCKHHSGLYVLDGSMAYLLSRTWEMDGEPMPSAINLKGTKVLLELQESIVNTSHVLLLTI